MTLQKGCRTQEVLTGEPKATPYPVASMPDPIDVKITWLVGQFTSPFKINRKAEKCFTPRRNPEIQQVQNPLLPLAAETGPKPLQGSFFLVFYPLTMKT